MDSESQVGQKAIEKSTAAYVKSYFHLVILSLRVVHLRRLFLNYVTFISSSYFVAFVKSNRKSRSNLSISIFVLYRTAFILCRA